MPSRRGLRPALSFALFSLWLALLFSGFSGRGTVHLLLAAALALFPWRQARLPASRVTPAAGGESGSESG